MSGALWEVFLAIACFHAFARVLISFLGSVVKHRLCWGFASEPYLAGVCTLLNPNVVNSTTFGHALLIRNYVWMTDTIVISAANMIAYFSSVTQVALALH